jgi:predicted enzyme related to lactoylglutathione lyase
MIGGVHTILYSKQADAVRAFFRDVLEFPAVDAGRGWLIFATPPGELAIHPAEERARHELYLMCADIEAEVARLGAKGVEFSMPIRDQGWGLLTQVKLPDGETLGLYEPRHPMAIQMKSTPRSLDKKVPAKKKKKRAGTRNAGGRKSGRS